MKNKIKVSLSALVIASSTIVAPAFASAAPISNSSSVQIAAKPADPTRGLTKAKRPSVSFEVWITSPTAIKVIKKESRGNCKTTGSKGKYRGKWQMTAGVWKTYGGLQFAPLADQATCDQQDQVAYKLWLARGWQPWGIKN